jgi:hypothetical protein
MSGDTDQRLADRLGQLPPPAVPPGLAARIVENATRLPQHRHEPVEPVEMPASTTLPRRRGWRWLPPAIGAAIAASAVAALFLQQGSADQARRTTGVQVAQKAPAQPPLALPQDKPAELVAAPPQEQGRMAAATPTIAPRPKVGEHIAGPSPSLESAPPAEAIPSQSQAPELARQQGSASKEGPSAQAFVGPPAIDDHGAPMLQSEPVSGLGISGSGAASPGIAPAPAPSRPGRGASTMPRF